MSNGIDSIVTRSKLQSALISLTGKVPWDDTASKAYDNVKDSFSKEMFSAFDQYKTGSLNINQLKNVWNDSLKKYYPLAYQKGMEIGKAPWEYGKFDKAWVTAAINHEKTFVSKFVNDIKNDAGIMDYDKRLQMYVDTLDGVRNNGYFEAIPDRVEIWWRLGSEDDRNCPDCLELAEKSPYSKYSLPAFPRTGETQCLCITTPDSRILTKRGLVPISDVKIGDLVLTHKRRWRKVTDTPRNEPNGKHRQGFVLGKYGRIVGCTTDHLFLTTRHEQKDEWKTLKDIQIFLSQIKSFDELKTPGIIGTRDKIIIDEKSISEKTILYDLTVEKDHSFVVEGLIAHNSNCRCELEVIIVGEAEKAPSGPQEVKRDRELELKYKEYFDREIPEGYVAPGMEDKLYLDDKFFQIYNINQKINITVDPTLRKELIAERKRLNHEAIVYMRSRGVYYVRPFEFDQPLPAGVGIIKPPTALSIEIPAVVLPGEVKPKKEK